MSEEKLYDEMGKEDLSDYKPVKEKKEQPKVVKAAGETKSSLMDIRKYLNSANIKISSLLKESLIWQHRGKLLPKETWEQIVTTTLTKRIE